MMKWTVLWIALASLLALSACSGGATTVTPTTVVEMPPVAGVEATVENTATAVQPPSPAATLPVEPSPAQVETATPEAATQAPAGANAENVAALPDPSGFIWSPVVSGLTRPLALVASPDETGRLFVLEQPGVIRIIADGSLLPEPFLDIRDRVGSSGNEQGLLGMDFHPDFAQNPYFYVNYTDGKGDTVIARFAISADDPNRADAGSERMLLTVDQPYANHNGGETTFGPDGYLYLGLGDGGSANDPQGNGQNLNTPLGKILRIDVNGGEPYVVPQDNPYAAGGGLPEIWASGLRNPWRFSFDRATGDLYIADVGQNQWEEIDFLAAGAPGGANFGWDYREGAHEFEGQPPAGLALIDPIYEYSHAEGCSVTGGYVYRGQDLPEFNGVYLFADYCSGTVWGLLRGPGEAWQARELFQTGMNITAFGEDSRGEIYLIDQASGGVYRLQRQ